MPEPQRENGRPRRAESTRLILCRRCHLSTLDRLVSLGKCGVILEKAERLPAVVVEGPLAT